MRLNLVHWHLAQDTVLCEEIAEIRGLRVFPPAVYRGQVQNRRLELMQVAVNRSIRAGELPQHLIKGEQVVYTAKPAVEHGQMAGFH